MFSVFSRRRRHGWWALAAALLVAACSRGGDPASAPPRTVRDWFDLRVGDRAVRLQLAVKPLEMQRGLMERRDLGADEGMLFVYPRPTTMSFWMHNTPLPLDIGFFDARGELKEVHAMFPFDETPIRSQSTELLLALEMNQGWFRKNGVQPGARLDLEALRAALKARGEDPAAFGL
jgi:uncharacterized protein